jgi:hypothetical protein
VKHLLTSADVEQQILDIADALEAETYRYETLAAAAADSEADWKLGYARAIVQQASHGSMKLNAAEKQARAELYAADELRIWKINDARRAASKEALLSLRARLDALRTLSATLRSQT